MLGLLIYNVDDASIIDEGKQAANERKQSADEMKQVLVMK